MNQRRQRNLKKKISAFILLPGILVFLALFLNVFFDSGKPLFISPIGKLNVDRATVEKNLRDNNISFTQITLDGSFYLVQISNNGQVILSSDKDIKKQISSLQRILVQLTIEGKPFKSVDFRFEEPIVSF